MKTILCVLLFTTPLLAQPVISAPARVQWDQYATSLDVANTYVVNVYIDSTTAKTPVLAKTCTGTGAPFTCSATLPAMTVGRHSLMFTNTAPATATTPAVEGPFSVPFDIVLVVPPAPPTNIRVTTS